MRGTRTVISSNLNLKMQFGGYFVKFYSPAIRYIQALDVYYNDLFCKTLEPLVFHKTIYHIT